MLTTELMIIIGPPLVAGLLISITHAPLGIEVLRRGIIFIDLAIAQIAGLGLVAAEIILHEPPMLIVQAAALGAAVLAGLFFRKIESRMPKHQEAIIGVAFILAASLTILILADHPFAGEKTTHLLSGQILFVSWGDVLYHLPVYLFTLATWFLIPRSRGGVWFYLIFALAITSSVQLVGVYVVFASLILPALSVVNFNNSVIYAWISGISAILLAMLVSVLSDLPTGPFIVITYTVVAILMLTIGKKKQLG